MVPDQTHCFCPPRNGRASNQHKKEDHLERMGEGRRGRRTEGPNHQGTAESAPGVQEQVVDVPVQDLEEWYTFFWGKDIADRKPAPSEQCYCMLRETHGERSTTKSMKDAPSKADTLFWQREVYERLPKQQDKAQGSKGTSQTSKGKGKSKPTWSPAQTQWSKGKQSQKGKPSKGTSKGKDSSWPKNWAPSTGGYAVLPGSPSLQQVPR